MKDPCPDVLKDIERFLKRTGISESRFGREVLKNSTLVRRIREGNVTLKTLRAVDNYLNPQPRGDK